MNAVGRRITCIALGLAVLSTLAACSNPAHGPFEEPALLDSRAPLRPIEPSDLPRTYRVAGKVAPLGWITAQPDGSIVATGYLYDVGTRPSGGIVPFNFVVHQEFGGLTVFHVLPVFGDALTRITDGSTTYSLSSEFVSDLNKMSDLEFRYLSARLSIHDGKVYADELVLTSKSQEWNGENNYTEFPPEGSLDSLRSLSGGANGQFWMSVGKPSTATTLTGLVESAGFDQDDAGNFTQGTFDIEVPDQLAGVLIAHVARVIVFDERAASEWPPPNTALRDIPVTYDGEHLVYGPPRK